MKGLFKTIATFLLFVLLNGCAAQQAMLDKQAQDRQAAIDLKIQNDKEEADALKAKRAAAKAKRQAVADARAERAAAAKAPLTTPVIPQLPVAVHLPAATASPTPDDPVGTPVKAAPTKLEKQKLESPTAQAKPKHDYEKVAVLAGTKAKHTLKAIAAKKSKSIPHPIAKNDSKKSPSLIAKKGTRFQNTVANNKQPKTQKAIVTSKQAHPHKKLASIQRANQQTTLTTHKSAATKQIASTKQTVPNSIPTRARQHEKHFLPIVAKDKPTLAEKHLMQAKSHATAKQKQLAKVHTKPSHAIATTDKHKLLAKNTEHKAVPFKAMNS